MPLTAAERASLKSKLAAIDRSIAESYDEEIQLVHRLNVLNVERQTLVAERKRVQNTVQAPVYGLPTEIITHIMSFVIIPCHPTIAFKVANALSHICHRWRQAVLYEPSFWTHITMKEGPPYDASQICLERSGAQILQVDIDMTKMRNYDQPEIKFLLKLASHLQRCRTFHFTANKLHPFGILLPAFCKAPTPHLRRFEVFCFLDEAIQVQGDMPSPSQPTAAFGGEAPKLGTMTISGIHVPWSTFPTSNLQHLEFDFHSSAGVERSCRTFFGILGSVHSLKSLTVMQGGAGLRFNHRWLEGSSVSGPSSTTTSDLAPPNPIRRLTLPSLTELVFTFTECEFTCDLLSLLSFPNVQKLTLEYLKGDSARVLDLIGGPKPSFPNVTHLRLLGLMSISDGRMLSFLVYAGKNVTHLHVNAVRCPTLKRIPQLVRWMAMERRVYLLPKLQEISTDGISPTELRQLIQGRPPSLRPKRVFMRRRDCANPEDMGVQWLMENLEVQYMQGSSDTEDGGD
ncbi:hypothetical protein FRC04_000623 [Tulasnella sp. 424]|nr:hypothetical protein FRC04_000623 [Tulasnella sp. 424]KAG8969157.1 hypothetical protein FRC05_001201 [Tulasnella sp. 425]